MIRIPSFLKLITVVIFQIIFLPPTHLKASCEPLEKRSTAENRRAARPLYKNHPTTGINPLLPAAAFGSATVVLATTMNPPVVVCTPVVVVVGNTKLKLVDDEPVTVVAPLMVRPLLARMVPVHTAPSGQHATWPAWSTAQLLSTLQHSPGAPSAAHARYDVGHAVPPVDVIVCRFFRSWITQNGSTAGAAVVAGAASEASTGEAAVGVGWVGAAAMAGCWRNSGRWRARPGRKGESDEVESALSRLLLRLSAATGGEAGAESASGAALTSSVRASRSPEESVRNDERIVRWELAWRAG